MALPTGLLPAFAFALTVGISLPATVGAHLLHRGGRSFGAALRRALFATGGLYLVGVVAVHFAAGGGSPWGATAALVVAGLAASVVTVAVPLAVGRRLVRGWGGVDSETALRYATYGWPLTTCAVFVIFVLPGGPEGGHLLSLAGPRTCLAGHCGIAVALVGAAALELAVAVFGPGAVGLLLRASVAVTRGQRTKP